MLVVVRIKMKGLMVWIVFGWEELFGDLGGEGVWGRGEKVRNGGGFGGFVGGGLEVMRGKWGGG